MKVLPVVMPIAEQLQVIQGHRLGVMLIQGAAGSGKTTTSLLRLKFLVVLALRAVAVPAGAERPEGRAHFRAPDQRQAARLRWSGSSRGP